MIKSISSVFFLSALFALSACSTRSIYPAQIDRSDFNLANWSDLPLWNQDPLNDVVSALQKSCIKLAQTASWGEICARAYLLDEQDISATRDFFERHFSVFQVRNTKGGTQGLITGYYTPVLMGSRTSDAVFRYPIYQLPTTLSNQQILQPRAQLMSNRVLKGQELFYLRDPIEVFFLQVQGSGHILLDNDTVAQVEFSGSNGQPYRSIGRWLIEQGELPSGKANMQAISDWAKNNPDRIEKLLNINPRFIFFKEKLSDQPVSTPLGTLGVPLTPERSIAVDKNKIPLGSPVFLSVPYSISGVPGQNRLNRLVFAQDTGNAIKGSVRADYYWGIGDQAGALAGRMHHQGQMWILFPKQE